MYFTHFLTNLQSNNHHSDTQSINVLLEAGQHFLFINKVSTLMITSVVDTQVFWSHEVTGGGRGKNVMMYDRVNDVCGD